MADDILDIEASSEELGKTAGKDEEVDKTTYPKLLGLERSKEVAQELVDEAEYAGRVSHARVGATKPP